MKQFIEWLKEQEELGECDTLAYQLTKLYDRYQKERGTSVCYVWRNYITTDEQDMDDIIFTELSKYINGYPSDGQIANEWEWNVEVEELTTAQFADMLKHGYHTEVQW